MLTKVIINSKTDFVMHLIQLETNLIERSAADSGAAAIRPVITAEISRIAAMDQNSFWYHFQKFYSDRYEAPPPTPILPPVVKAVSIIILIILMFSLSGFAQINREICADENNIKKMLNVPCGCHMTDTLTVPKYPTSYRSSFVATAFDFVGMDFIPIEIYYSESSGKPLYLHLKGATRHFSNLIPLPEPGFYFVRFFHPTFPALIEIEARKDGQIFVRGFGKCTLKN